MKSLIAVMTCHRFGERVQAIRDTWLKDVDPEKFDVRFFVGGGESQGDVIALDCPDDYNGLPLKVQAARLWAVKHGYPWMLKLDDDVYAAGDRLEAPNAGDYVGRLRGPSGKFPAPYCSGFAYWLSLRAMKSLMNKTWNNDVAEDRWTGNMLLELGIYPENDFRYAVVWSKKNSISGREAPLKGNPIIVSCEYSAGMMKDVHSDYKNGLPSKVVYPAIAPGPLSKVCVMIKTFLRDGMLKDCIVGLERNFKDAKMVIIDDGYDHPTKVTKYSELRRSGHQCIWMPFDSGFGSKANAAVKACDREYVLIGSDDFDFSDPRVRPGVEKMVKVLDANPSIGVASGRVDNRPYEYCFEYSNGGDTIQEMRRYHGVGSVGDVTYQLCDLTVNYSLLRRSMLDKVRWDGGETKIGGGEHAAFFIDVAAAGYRVCVVDGANINQMKSYAGAVHPSYGTYRGRARQPGRICLKRRGINTYILADGLVEKS